ncbi:MAG: glutamate--tRNA ligase [Candidatus Magasanikbacteria bacterium]|nr:glutamate--tRNA ligase [Candidatus Magasanikbacteria bacterium]
MIRTRFAPSPTGYLHVGGLRTALYSYLFAKQKGGKFLLRIEDTDRERFVTDGTLNILKSLYWAGIVPDEGAQLGKGDTVTQKGKHGPYIQSERLDIYKEYAAELLDAGHAYYCFCNSERLEQLRETQQKNKMPTGYDGACAAMAPAEAKKRVAAGEKCVVRLKMPKDGETRAKDLIRGEVVFKNELQDDFIMLKSDGYPTYHLASVVDDNAMEITHVVRGEEWLSSLPKHIQLYAYFKWEIPEFSHLPLLLNPDKSKLSKRQGDVAVEDFRAKGYLPEAMVNFIAFLGWNPGTAKEMYSLEELVKDFSLEKVSKASAVFNLEKLDWYNKEYLRQMPLEELAKQAMPWFEKAGLNPSPNRGGARGGVWFESVLALERERVATLSELPAAVKFVFILPEYEAKLLIWRKGTLAEALKILPEIKDFLAGLKKWDKASLEIKIGEWIKEKDYATGSVLWPLRVSLSGQENSPGPYEIAEVLGKDESLKRLETAIAKLKN